MDPCVLGSPLVAHFSAIANWENSATYYELMLKSSLIPSFFWSRMAYLFFQMSPGRQKCIWSLEGSRVNWGIPLHSRRALVWSNDIFCGCLPFHLKYSFATFTHLSRKRTNMWRWSWIHLPPIEEFSPKTNHFIALKWVNSYLRGLSHPCSSAVFEAGRTPYESLDIAKLPQTNHEFLGKFLYNLPLNFSENFLHNLI